MDIIKSIALKVVLNSYEGEYSVVPVSDTGVFGESREMLRYESARTVCAHTDDTCEIDILHVTARFPNGSVDTTLVSYKAHDFPVIYIYPTMSELPLSVINQLVTGNFAAKGKVGYDETFVSAFPTQQLASTSHHSRVVKFCDGSYVELVDATSQMFQRQPLHHSRPFMGQERVPASMFGGRVNEQSSIFGQSVEKSNEDEVAALRRELRELTGRYLKLEEFVYENNTVEFLGLECHQMTKLPGNNYNRAPHLRGAGHKTKLFMTDDNAYIANDGKWLEYRGDRDILVTAWFKELFKSSFGLNAIRDMGFFYCNGVRFELQGAQLSEDIIKMHNFYGWDICEGSVCNTVISDYGHGKGYVLIKDNATGFIETFVFEANKLDLNELELSEEYVGRAKQPKVCGYAYTGNVSKAATVWNMVEARAAVRATVVQASKEKLNYRRKNQMVIDRDFKLERINDFPKYDFLPEMNSGDLYRFKLMKSNITVYVCYDGVDAPTVLDLGEVDSAKLDLIDGTTGACRLRGHCVRLAELIGLA